MDSFSNKIDEDIRSAVKTYGGAYAKYIKDSFLASIGSARAEGRLTLSELVGQLAKNYNFFLGHQGMDPSITSMVMFIQSVFEGARFTEKELNKIAPSRPNFNIAAPHAEGIKEEFGDLAEHTQLDQEELHATVHNIKIYANGDKRDAALVIEYMKYMRLNHPDALEIPEMKELASLGERIDNNQAKIIFTTIARLILRNEAQKQQAPQSGSAANPAPTDDNAADGLGDGDGLKRDADGVSYLNGIAITPKPKQQSEQFEGLPQPKQRGDIMTEEKAETALHHLGFGLDEIEELWEDSRNISEFQTEVKNRFKFQIINAMSAHLFPFIAQHISATDFGNQFLQNSEGAALLNSLWPTSYNTYKFAYAGGDSDEITAELNHYLDDSIHASVFFALCVKAYAQLKSKGA